jgi:hypothetical protein
MSKNAKISTWIMMVVGFLIGITSLLGSYSVHISRIEIVSGQYNAGFVVGVLAVIGAFMIGFAIGEAINLASNKETSVIEIANIINGLTGNKEILYTQRRNWDKIVRRMASIDKANRILGYQPKMDINTGIDNVYKWLTKNIDNINNKK